MSVRFWGPSVLLVLRKEPKAGQKAARRSCRAARAYICDGCVCRAHPVIAECSFCGERRYQVAAIAPAGDRRICDECLGRCDAIMSEEPPVPLR